MSRSLVVVVLAAVLGALAGTVLRFTLARPLRGIELPRAAVALGLGAAGAVLAVAWEAGALPGRRVPVLAVLAVLTVGGVGTDVVARRLPDRLTVPALLAALGAAVPLGVDGLGAGVAVGGLLAVLLGAVRFTAPAALGGGDVKVSAALGVPLGALAADAASMSVGGPGTAGAVSSGTAGTVVTLVLVGLGLPVVASALLLVAAAVRRRRQLPYGPALLAAAWVELAVVT